MSFKAAVNNTPVYDTTNNGMKTLVSSMGKNADLFFLIGAARNSNIIPVFEQAFSDNSEMAQRILLWARDVRGGAGERETSRKLLVHLESFHPETLSRLVPVWPEFGRWDDLLVLQTKEGRKLAFTVIQQALLSRNGLCAKWMPRKGKDAAELREFLGLSPKTYRKFLVRATKVVEHQMCAKEWESIEFGKVPSVASARYRKAFFRHTPELYAAYAESLKNGKSKINASAIFPHDVIKPLIDRHSSDLAKTEREVMVEQWKALPNYLGKDHILPMVDVSGSMYTPVGGNTTALAVAVSLGLYLADKQDGAFKDMWLNFSGSPRIRELKGDVVSKVQQMAGDSEWGMNTNVVAAFEEILRVAKENNVPQADMPKYLLILSDMEFDSCVEDGKEVTALEAVRNRFENANYKIPNVIFWNLNGRQGNVPVRFDQQGVALVSGFSPNILKTLLKNPEEMNPERIMLNTVMADRYDIWK